MPYLQTVSKLDSLFFQLYRVPWSVPWSPKGHLYTKQDVDPFSRFCRGLRYVTDSMASSIILIITWNTFKLDSICYVLGCIECMRCGLVVSLRQSGSLAVTQLNCLRCISAAFAKLLWTLVNLCVVCVKLSWIFMQLLTARKMFN